MVRRLTLLIGISFGLFWAGNVAAHPISISDAYVLVENDRIVVRLEVFVEDLYLFHDLKMTSENELPPAEVERGLELHKAFLQERFRILDADGKLLSGRLLGVDREDVPEEPIPFGQLMFFKLVYEYEYAIPGPPDFLTFVQNFSRESSVLPAEVLVKVKPLHGRRFQQTLLPNQPWTIRFEEQSTEQENGPPLSAKERFEQLRRETLGITTYGETYAFLYLTEQEWRLEVLIPLATLARSLDREFQPDGLLDLDEQQELREPIEKLFRDQIVILSADQAVQPLVDRIDFFGVAFTDFSQRAQPRAVSLANARVGIILSYPRSPSMREGELQWNLFNEFLYQVNLAVIEGAQTSKVILRQIEEQNEYSWNIETKAISTTVDAERLAVLKTEIPTRLWWREIVLGILTAVLLLAVMGLVAQSRQSSKRTAENQRQQASGRWGLLAICSAFGMSGLLFLFLATDWGIRQETEMSAGQRSQISSVLLETIYSAFNQRNEDQIFGELEQVVAGPLLRELYLEIRKSMTIEEQGGAQARAGEVQLKECVPADLPTDSSFEPGMQTWTCIWEVPGTVEHWGHIHERITRYQGRLSLAPRAVSESQARWKLVDVDLIQQDQSVIETTVRQF